MKKDQKEKLKLQNQEAIKTITKDMKPLTAEIFLNELKNGKRSPSGRQFNFVFDTA